MRTNKLISLLLILSFAASAVAQKTAPDSDVQRELTRLRQHIGYLASDQLDGRRTGTPGANAAAKYIAEQMHAIGLRPRVPMQARTLSPDKVPPFIDKQQFKMREGEREPQLEYYQGFPYVAGVELGKGNGLSYRVGNGPANRVEIGADWMPVGFSPSASLASLPVEFVGYGLSISELKYDDYAGGAIKGKIALALTGTPDGDNPHGKFANYTDVRWKAIAAKDQGAKALLLISSEKKFTDERLTALRYDNMGGDAGLPVAVISQQTAAALLHHSFPAASVVPTAPDLGQQIMPTGQTGPHAVALTGVSVSLTTDTKRQDAPGYNIVGGLEGNDPQLKNEVVVIGAHYDHLGRGGEGSLAPRSGEVHHGADDNASGVAGLLEIARDFAAHKKELKRSVVFIAFSGEEEGLIGSNYYVNHPLVPLAQTVAMINMDMIGRLKDGKLTVGGIGTAADFKSLVSQANIAKELVKKGLGGAPDEFMAHDLFNLALSEDGFGPSDHSSFYAKQIPVLFFFTNSHDDYHKPSDTADKINYEGELGVIDLVRSIAWKLDTDAAKPVYTVAKTSSPGGKSAGFRVYLGTIPNYADSNDGLLLDGVRDDSPASKAGLLAGDKVVKIAGREIKNVYDYTYALGEMKSGETYEIQVLRNGKVLTMQIMPAARK
jgi:aminopeptidase YwaD